MVASVSMKRLATASFAARLKATSMADCLCIMSGRNNSPITLHCLGKQHYNSEQSSVLKLWIHNTKGTIHPRLMNVTVKSPRRNTAEQLVNMNTEIECLKKVG